MYVMKFVRKLVPKSGFTQALLALIAVIIVSGGIFAPVWDDWLRIGSREVRSPGEQPIVETWRIVETNSETLRNVGILIGGVAALVFGMWRARVADRQATAAQEQAKAALGQLGTTQEQLEIARQSLLSDTYQRVAEMLGSDVLAVRLVGIYGLQQLAEDEPSKYHIRIMKLFCAYVKHPTGGEQDEHPIYQRIEDPLDLPIPSADVQAVMNAIGSRSTEGRSIEFAEGFTLDLRGADLVGIDVHGMNFARADLRSARLFHANLINTDLSQARMHEARLEGASLHCTNFFKAVLPAAQLNDCVAEKANFGKAKLLGANLPDVNLKDAKLRDADLNSANLLRASFECADISGTKFAVDYVPDDLDPTLVGVSFEHVTQQQLSQAVADPDKPPILNVAYTDHGTGQPITWPSPAPPQNPA